MSIIGIDHVQLAMPRGREAEARAFYGDLLGLLELPKPQELIGRGGVWFYCGNLQLHLGIEEPFKAARKAHPGLRISDYLPFISSLAQKGIQVTHDMSVHTMRRAFIDDPFGNRIELVDGDAD